MTFLEENAKLKGQLKYTKNNDIEKNNDRDSPMKTKKKSKSKKRISTNIEFREVHLPQTNKKQRYNKMIVIIILISILVNMSNKKSKVSFK